MSPIRFGIACALAALSLDIPAFAQGLSQTAPVPLNNADTDGWVSDTLPEIINSGHGTWITAWQSSGLIDNYSDFVFARSLDNGETWSDPAPLSPDAATNGIAADLNIQLSTDGAGNWVAVWQREATRNDPDWDLMVSQSSDDGVTWSSPATLSHDAVPKGGANPQLRTDSQGNWLLMWHSSKSPGGVYGTDSDILMSRSTDNGFTWTPATAVNTDAIGDRLSDNDPEFATDGNGAWGVVWINTYGIHFSLSTDHSLTWSPPIKLSDHGFEAQIANDGQGNWVVIWYEHGPGTQPGNTDAEIMISRSTDNCVTWSIPVALNTNASIDEWNDLNPKLKTDGAGNWIALWTSGDILGGISEGDWDIFFAHSTDNGETWTAPAHMNTNASVDGASDDFFARMATDRLGHWVAVWQTFIEPERGETDILTCRWTIELADYANLYVGFNASTNGVGTQSNPFDNLKDAVDVAIPGATINLSPANSPETFTGANALGVGHKALTLRKTGTAGGTPVRIGALSDSR